VGTFRAGAANWIGGDGRHRRASPAEATTTTRPTADTATTIQAVLEIFCIDEGYAGMSGGSSVEGAGRSQPCSGAALKRAVGLIGRMTKRRHWTPQRNPLNWDRIWENRGPPGVVLQIP
jgi:hypothetical protein